MTEDDEYNEYIDWFIKQLNKSEFEYDDFLKMIRDDNQFINKFQNIEVRTFIILFFYII